MFADFREKIHVALHLIMASLQGMLESEICKNYQCIYEHSKLTLHWILDTNILGSRRQCAVPSYKNSCRDYELFVVVVLNT